MDYQEYYDIQKSEAGQVSGGWADQMIEAFKEFLQNKEKDAKILDIGCAFGTGVLAINALGYPNVVGVDLIKEKIEYGKNLNANVLEMDMHDLKFLDNEFDYSFMSHSIEHSLDPIKATLEMIRVTKKQAFIITPIEEPNGNTHNSPHTSPFKNLQDWLNVLNKVSSQVKINVSYIQKHRLGEEIWTTFSK